MNRSIALVAVGILAIGVYSQSAIAGSCFSSGCSLGSKAAKVEDAVVNTTCPVMGGAVSENTPYKVAYSGKTIGFCCAGCITAFNEDPDKYFDKVSLVEGEELTS